MPPGPKSSSGHKLTTEQKLDAIRLITRKLVTRDSGLAGILLWIPFAIGSEKEQAIAYTDGKTIYYCDEFFVLPPAQQLAVVIHETLHVVLQHPLRFRKLYLQTGDKFNSKIANICADAIVIRAIQCQPKIGPLDVVNPYIVTAEDIVTPEALKKIPGPQWTFEMLYEHLSKRVDKAIKQLMDKYGDKFRDISEGRPCGTGNSHLDEMEGRVWRERLKRASAGSQPGSILREVLKDLPTTKTPWQKHFREFLIANVMPTTTADWARPSRRLLASKGRLGYYEPGVQRELGVRKAGIVIDTSGSIDEELLNLFIMETNTIMEQTGCHVVLISADHVVQSVDYFTEKITSKYKCKGGGGTSFVPALEELKKHEVDCCVYLTDMCGEFPPKAPGYPVMWATMNPEMKAPFGKMVEVEYVKV